MAGKGDADGAAARGEAWVAAVFGALTREVDKVVAAVAASEDKLETDVAVDRRARAITNIARATKAVGALCMRTTSRAPGTASEGTPEDQMSEDDIDDIDAPELERLRAELQSRLDHLRALVERKGVEGQPVGEPAAPGDPCRAPAAWPSISAVG